MEGTHSSSDLVAAHMGLVFLRCAQAGLLTTYPGSNLCLTREPASPLSSVQLCEQRNQLQQDQRTYDAKPVTISSPSSQDNSATSGPSATYEDEISAGSQLLRFNFDTSDTYHGQTGSNVVRLKHLGFVET